MYSSSDTSANRTAVPYTMAKDGILHSVSIYHNGGSGDMLLAVYSDDSGSPEYRLAVTEETAVNSNAGWQTIELTQPISVEKDETIWLAWVFESNPGTRYTSGSPGRAVSSQYWAGQMPSDFGTSSSSSYIYSVCANYIAADQQPAVPAASRGRPQVTLIGNPYMYTARRYDIETGLYYYRARYYNPYIGRFTQLDPARDGMNWYAYCGNNSINYTDPSGKSFLAEAFYYLPIDGLLPYTYRIGRRLSEVISSRKYYYEHFQIPENYYDYHFGTYKESFLFNDACDWDFDNYTYSWTGKFSITNAILDSDPDTQGLVMRINKMSNGIKLIINAYDIASTITTFIRVNHAKTVYDATKLLCDALQDSMTSSILSDAVDVINSTNSIIRAANQATDECKAYMEIRVDKKDRSLLGNDTTYFWCPVIGIDPDYVLGSSYGWNDWMEWYENRYYAIRAISDVADFLEVEYPGY